MPDIPTTKELRSAAKGCVFPGVTMVLRRAAKDEVQLAARGSRSGALVVWVPQKYNDEIVKAGIEVGGFAVVKVLDRKKYILRRINSGTHKQEQVGIGRVVKLMREHKAKTSNAVAIVAADGAWKHGSAMSHFAVVGQSESLCGKMVTDADPQKKQCAKCRKALA